ncbi:rhodanese-like domain-containing protein [Tropicimonas isoalkanivorans]|uniref:Rhodanese-related sulfurtransferase n=1 Tax=Tropicimonas isoalkanivorans TaxID=441112 RepID=A0A1I1N4V3_9RHOB|nr:rhodanese-like domain-containing protein [Tropicimonas isoalkanivorans]SFC92376.1 Rhodanese-related sulfurtransferase [Tropicimonas isoalkanivorans]
MLLTVLNPFAAKATHVDGETAISMVESENAVLVDVRDASELDGGQKAQGAINIPLAALNHRANPRDPACDPALRRDRPIVLYCATGARSGMAGKVMRALGYEKVYDMGPLGAWANAGGMVVG